MIKRSIRILFLFFLGTIAIQKNIFAANLTTAGDSLELQLLRQLSSLKPGDESRLAIYKELSKIVKDTQIELKYIDALLKEAQEQGNNEYICEAYLARLILAYNTFDVEGVNKWYNLLEPIARKEKLYTLMFWGRRGVVDMYNISGEYELEEKEALKMLDEARVLNSDVGMIAAYQCLSHAYRATFREKEAAQVLEKGYEIAYRTQDKSSILELNNLLIGTYQGLKDQPNILRWTRNLDVFLNKKIETDPSAKEELKGWFLLTYLAYLSYYTNESDFKHAETYLKLAEEYKVTGYGVYDNYYHLARYNYFRKAGMYKQALTEVDMIIDLYKELSPISYGAMNFEKAFILEQLGEMDDALALYKHSFFVIDSVLVVTLNTQTEQLKKDYDTDRLLLQKEKIQSNIQTLYLSLVALIIVILIWFAVHAYRIRNRLRKSEEEMRGIAEAMEHANLAKELFLSNISTSISGPLNSVVEWSLKLASDEVQDLDARQQISQTLNKTSAKLMKMINNILNLSRIEAGMMKCNLEDIEIVPFIQGVVANMSSKGVVVELILPDTKKELRVHADISRLQEIFNNVLVADDETLKLSLCVLENGTSLQIRITGTALAVNTGPLQEITIANEVNRLLVEYLGGQYTIQEGNYSSVSAICFVLPLVDCASLSAD